LHTDQPFIELAGQRLILKPHVAGAPVAEAWRTIAAELIEHLHAALAAAHTEAPHA
jgi:hypothetical protein